MKLKAFCLLLVLFVLASCIYISTQRPKFWCDRQWAGMALYRGGYRSWTLTFCDGFAYLDGKWQPVVVETNGYRKGFHRVPIYQHTDLNRILKANGMTPSGLED